jgi:probable rRNA maturation factor
VATRFFFDQIPSFVFNKTRTNSWINKVLRAEKKLPGKVDIIFTGDTSLLEMNRNFLSHNYYTDVISFPGEDEKKVSGDIYISIDRVKDNAGKYKVTFDLELLRVIIHGVLHLAGYTDKSPAEKKIMTGKEDRYLKIY